MWLQAHFGNSFFPSPVRDPSTERVETETPHFRLLGSRVHVEKVAQLLNYITDFAEFF